MCQLASDRLAAEETKRQIIKRFLANSGGSPYHGILHGRVIRSLFAPEHRAIIQQAFNITDPNSVPVVRLAWKNRPPHSGQMLQDYEREGWQGKVEDASAAPAAVAERQWPPCAVFSHVSI